MRINSGTWGTSKSFDDLMANRIGVSSYSFWAFRNKELRDLHSNLEHAARMGFDGLEILQRQFENTDRATLQKVKRHAFVLGLDLMGYSTHQGFLSPDKEKRQRNIDHTLDCLEQAYQLASRPCGSTPAPGAPQKASTT